MSRHSITLHPSRAQAIDSDQVSDDSRISAMEVIDDTFCPEGGWQGWMTITGAFLVQFATFGYTNSFGVFQGCVAYISSSEIVSKVSFDWRAVYFYVREFLTLYSPSDIGWIGGTQICLVLASGMVTGSAFDKGYFHHMMIAGALLNSFSFFMLSFCHQNQYYQVFLCHGLGAGLAAGLVYTPTLAISSHYFKRHRALSMGIVASGTALGAVVHPIMLNHLLDQPNSFARAIRISAALNSGLLLIANLMMRARLPPSKRHIRLAVAEFARDVPYVLVVAGGLFIVFGISFAVFFIQLYSRANGISSQISQYSLPIMNAASIVGRTVPAMFVLRCGIVNLVIAITISMAVLLYSLMVVKTAQGMISFAIIYGFIEGASITLTPVMLASLAKEVDEIGARIGVSFALSGVIGLFCTPIEGALLTNHLHWWRPIVFTGTAVSGAAFFYILARFHLVQRMKTQIV